MSFPKTFLPFPKTWLPLNEVSLSCRGLGTRWRSSGGVIVISYSDSRHHWVSRWLRARLRATPGRVLCEVWGFWMPPRGLSLWLCSRLLFLWKSAFLPFLGPAGSEEHLVGNCQLWSRWQPSAESSRQMSWCNPRARCGAAGGTWLGPRRHCSPIRPDDQPQIVSQTEQGYSVSHPGAPWETSASRRTTPSIWKSIHAPEGQPRPGARWFN